MDNASHQGPLGRALEIWRTRGTGELSRRVAARLGDAAFKTNSAVWFGKELSPADSPEAHGTASLRPSPSPQAPRAGGGTPGDFAAADPLELGEWLRQSGGLAWAADARELEVAAARGHWWTTWRVDGRTAAFCKVGGGRVFIVDFDRAFDLPGGIAYLSDVYVMSQMRRKGIGRELLGETLRFLERRGFAGVACHIPRSNSASASLFGSLGFAPLGEVRFTRILGIPFFSTRPERLLAKMSSGRRPGTAGEG